MWLCCSLHQEEPGLAALATFSKFMSPVALGAISFKYFLFRSKNERRYNIGKIVNIVITIDGAPWVPDWGDHFVRCANV